jgi:hypothetical protein
VRAAPYLAVAAVLLAACGGEKDGLQPPDHPASVPSARACYGVGGSDGVRYQLCGRTGTGDPGEFVRLAGGRTSLPVSRPVKGPAGHWSWAALSPDGSTLLAQWVAECEVPLAFFISVRGGRRQPASRGRDGPVTSIALGWTERGLARIAFPSGPCGGRNDRLGVYLVSVGGGRRFERAIGPRDRMRAFR